MEWKNTSSKNEEWHTEDTHSRVIAHQSEVDGHAASVAVWDDCGATANRSYSSLLER